MLKDGTMAVTLHFEPKDRATVMAMMGEPGASIACVRLVNGHAAKPAAGTTYRDLGPICREAIDLCANGKFREYVRHVQRLAAEPGADACKAFILQTCHVDSRKELDTAEGARDLFIAHVRKPFWAWLEKNK